MCTNVHTGALSGTRGHFFQRELAGFWTHKAINFSCTSNYGSDESLSGKTSERKSLPLKLRHAMWRSSESEECRETTKGVLGIIASGGRGGVERSDSGYSRLKRPSSISFLGKKKHSAKPQWARKRQRSPRRNPQSAAQPPPAPRLPAGTRSPASLSFFLSLGLRSASSPPTTIRKPLSRSIGFAK